MPRSPSGRRDPAAEPRRYIDAATIVTPSFNLAARAVRDVIAAEAIGVVYGDAGLGKTYAVEAATRDERDVVWAEFPTRMTERELVAQLLRRITGVAYDDTRFRMTGTLLEVLAERPRLLVVDEAQRLDRRGIESLRYLWDAPESRLALLLVGGQGCWALLSRYEMLRSRLYRRVAFAPLLPAEMLARIRDYHALYAEAPDELLLFDRRELRARQPP